MNYLIVDDEPIAHQIILKMSESLPFMKLVGQCYNALEAIDFLGKNSVDLMFLDVQLPQLTGFDFLRTLKHPPQVIVISAHAQFALEGYDLNVTDYLLKPFSFERFLRAVNKARAQQSGQMTEDPLEMHASMFIKDGKKHHQVRFEDIAILQAADNYTLVHLAEGRILTQESLTDLLKRLPDSFLRVHKSYAVARQRIELIEGNELRVGKMRIPIGRVYKANVAKLLGD